MFQASQRAVVQNVNMILVNIRTVEVAYFSTCFNTFGTQAAVLTGALCGIISNNHTLEPLTSIRYVWQIAYFTSTAVCVVSGCQVLLSCLFASVYGQGMALRGPVGSIVQTVDGMIIEQQQIVNCFIFLIIWFVIQAAFLFMIMMDFIWGVVCFGIMILGLLITYHYALRIYNRFYMPKRISTWDSDESPSNSRDHTHKNVELLYVIASDARDRLSFDKQIANSKDVTEGYLSVKSKSKLNFDVWTRRYFIIVDRNIFFFADQKAYTTNPGNPLNHRPIDVDGYRLQLSDGREPPYLLTLLTASDQDERVNWYFRCDTESEFLRWSEIFKVILMRK